MGNQERARPCRLGAKGSAQTRLRLALVSLRPRTAPHGSCWPKWPVAYALRAPQTSVSATLLRQTEWRYPGLAPANSCTITTSGYARRTDRVGISGPTGDLGTAMAWLRPVALLQSSPPFGEWRGSGGKGPVLGWLLCSDAIPARSDEPEGGLTKPGRDGTCLRGTCMVQPRDARKIPLGGAQG